MTCTSCRIIYDEHNSRDTRLSETWHGWIILISGLHQFQKSVTNDNPVSYQNVLQLLVYRAYQFHNNVSYCEINCEMSVFFVFFGIPFYIGLHDCQVSVCKNKKMAAIPFILSGKCNILYFIVIALKCILNMYIDKCA